MPEIIVAEQALSGWTEDSGLYILEALEIFTKIMPCREYEIMFDGTKYVRAAKIITNSSQSITYIGNGYLMGLSEENTEEPFCIAVILDSGEIVDVICTNQSGDSHTVSVTKTDAVLKEYEFGGFAFNTGMNTVGLTYSFVDLVANEKYILKIDGTEYPCEAKITTLEDGLNTMTLGNLALMSQDFEDTGEPFLFMVVSPMDGAPLGISEIGVQADSEKTSYTIAISLAEKAKTGVDIVLYDRNGEPVTYEGIETITTDTPVDGERATFTYGTLISGVEIGLDFASGDQKLSVPDGSLIKEATVKKPATLVPENILVGVDIAGVVGTHKDDTVLTGMEIPLDMAEGDQKLSVPDGYVVKTAVIKKPATLVPENIVKGVEIGGVTGTNEADIPLTDFEIELDLKDGDQTVSTEEGYSIKSAIIKKPELLSPENIVSGVEIAGVVGEYEAPKLFPPTNVSKLSDGKKKFYRVYNPDKNGEFADSILVVNTDETVVSKVKCAGSTTDIYAEDLKEISKKIFANFYAKMSGRGFSPSDMWNSVHNLYMIILLDYQLENVSLDEQPTRAFTDDILSFNATAEDGYYLPKTISWKDSEDLGDIDYDPDTGAITVSNLSTNANVMSAYVLCISAVDTPWLRDVTIESYREGVLEVSYDKNSEFLVLFINGEEFSKEEPKETAVVPNIVITEKPTGATYGFELASDGYYTSTNKAINNSYAICRIDISTKNNTTLTIDCINYAESNYDYGLISKLDTAFAFSNTSDSSYYKSFKGQSSASVVQVTYDVPEGEHYFYIKYRKDGSGNYNSDSFKFKISSYTSVTEYIHSFDLSPLVSSYAILNVTVKALADGYTDSDEATMVIENIPTIQLKVKTLVIGNLLESVESVRVYFDDSLIETLVRTSGELEIDISEYYTDYAGEHTAYVIVSGENIEDTQSNVLEMKPLVFGVEHLEAYTSSELIRTDDSIGMGYTIEEDGTIVSDFDNEFPWCALEVVEDSNGNKFVQFPRMYFRVKHKSNTLSSVAVSAAPKGEESDWYEVEPFCVGCYLAAVNDSKLSSVSGSNMTTATPQNIEKYARNMGENYIAYDLYHDTILKFLWWIEYATKSSKVIATGRTSSGLTGLTDDLATPSGRETTSKAMRYRFIEDFIHRVFLEGCKYTGYSSPVYATSDPKGFSYNTYAYMNKLAYISPESYSYPCVMSYGWDDTHPFLCLPDSGTSNSNREVGYCSSYGIGNSSVGRGRDIGTGNYDHLDTVASVATGTACRTRLVYLGELKQ